MPRICMRYEMRSFSQSKEYCKNQWILIITNQKTHFKRQTFYRNHAKIPCKNNQSNLGDATQHCATECLINANVHIDIKEWSEPLCTGNSWRRLLCHSPLKPSTTIVERKKTHTSLSCSLSQISYLSAFQASSENGTVCEVAHFEEVKECADWITKLVQGHTHQHIYLIVSPLSSCTSMNEQ